LKEPEGFFCLNCRAWVLVKTIGTKHRNHCPFCLWSKHVDKTPGDRKSVCAGKMAPIGLTFKHEGFDKYGKKRQGELMIIHRCLKCGKISINRIAGDDSPAAIWKVFRKSAQLSSEVVKKLAQRGIVPLRETDRDEVEKQLFGRRQ